MKLRIILVFTIFLGRTFFCLSQSITQTVKGTVFDAESNFPLPGATVAILDSGVFKGTTTDLEGYFRMEAVPVGRYNFRISYLGYETFTFREIIVSSGKEVVLNVGLSESVNEIEQVEVKAYSNKSEPMNTMATISAKQVSMEEANRYAGGFDDPARLVSSYAGVTSQVGNNGIVIRGNSPKGLLWRMEGVQIPNPNHFGDYISLGGGSVTALSSQTMATSDFFTGAFPAEFGNALSGVFDINMRTGNTGKREHVFQAGLIGIDFASEGPFKKGKKSSYLFNYRYSTLGLIAPILPKEMGKLKYQDLSFKLNFPFKGGAISLWGIGAYDFQGKEAEKDSVDRKDENDKKEYLTTMTMAAAGINFRKIIDTKTYFNATLAATENSIDWMEKELDNNLVLLPKRDITDYRWRYTFTGYINHKFSARHVNKTGIIVSRQMYNMNIKNALDYGHPLITYIDEKNGTNLLQFYSQSKVSISKKFTANVGIHSQLLTLNKHYTLEPRAGIKWKFNPLQSFSFAYGLHAQMEMIQLYLIEHETSAGIIMPNKNLDFNKSHHFVVGYDYQVSENLHFKTEIYFQHLFDIPVIPDSTISTININEIWNFNDELVNDGTGKNYGIDFTLERYLNKGYYYLFTASVFDSKYTAGDNRERNTKYNRNYVFNVLGGKELKIGKGNKNLLNVNIRFSYMGGERIIPLDLAETFKRQEIVEDPFKSYSQKLSDAPILSVAVNYRKNKPKHSSIWSFQLINALAHADFQEFEFDEENNRVKNVKDLLFIPNISYKIEF